MKYLPWILLGLLAALGYSTGAPGAVSTTQSAAQPTSPLVVAQPPPAWVRHTDPSGITFDIPGDWIGEEVVPQEFLFQYGFDQTSGIDHASMLLAPDLENDEWADEFMAEVLSWTGAVGDHAPADVAFPNVLDPGTMPGFYVSWIPLNDATRAMFYVTDHPYGDPSMGLVPDICCKTVNAWVVNLGCRMEIAFAEPFLSEDAAGRVGGFYIASIVAEYFPVLDHMVRSVEFPAPCSESAPVAPREWITMTDALGITYAMPSGFEAQPATMQTDGSVEKTVWQMRPITIPVGTFAPPFTVDVRRADRPGLAAPFYQPEDETLVVMDSGEEDIEEADRVNLYLYGYDPLLMASGSDGGNLNAFVVASLAGDGCGTTVTLSSWIDLMGYTYLDARPLSEVIAEHAPLFDHAYRNTVLPPECLATP